MKRLHKTISILSFCLILSIAIYYAYAYYKTRNEYGIFLKASERMIKDEIIKNGATGNGGDELVKLFLAKAYLTEYRTDEPDMYNFKFKWNSNVKRRGPDGWVSKNHNGIFYIKAFWTPSEQSYSPNGETP